jgi:malate dehydrogenase (oxaloacetate-decarboxylating)(NADP+)
MANPVPEIDYNLSQLQRDDIIMATVVRSQSSNNVLGFPYIFRGVLRCSCYKINEAMKMAAVKALALLAKKSFQNK